MKIDLQVCAMKNYKRLCKIEQLNLKLLVHWLQNGGIASPQKKIF